jgi:hypothetical protein
MTCGSQIRNYPEIVKYFNADELMEGTAGVQLMYGRDIVAPPGNQVATEKTNIDLQHRESPVYSTTTHPALRYLKNSSFSMRMNL